MEDPRDTFKRDGLNKRTVNLYIDGTPYTAYVLTALNDDTGNADMYGEKFYDFVDIEINQTNHSASYGAAADAAASPYKIKYADDSSDKFTITQKNRIVNNSLNDTPKTVHRSTGVLRWTGAGNMRFGLQNV